MAELLPRTSPPIQAEEQLRLLTEAVRDYAFITYDPEGRITSWSAGAEQILLWREAEVLGQPGSIIFIPEDCERKEPEKEIATALRKGSVADERWHLKKDGSRFWASGVMTALRDEAGQLVGFAKVLRDLTERKRAEDSLRESEERLQLALATADLGTWELDLTTSRSDRRSLRHDQLFGHAELQAKWGPEIAEQQVVAEDRAAFRAALAQAEETGELRSEARVRWPDGSVHWLSVVGRTYYDDQGRPTRMAGVVGDVTERKQAEQDRERLRVLERDLLERRLLAADAEIDRSRDKLRDLAAQLVTVQEEERRRLARELHDDLAQRMAILDLELSRLAEGLDRPRDQRAAQIAMIRDRVGSITEDVRRISYRLHPGTLEHLGLYASLQHLVEEFSATWPVPVDFAGHGAPERIPLRVSTALYRIVQEALHNITKHAPASPVAVLLSGTGGILELCIEDRGPGFDVQAVQCKRGLGLLSMRERIRLLGGSLLIDSRPGVGTTITVRVPLESEEAAGSEAGG